jgi:hypothetical protein
MEKATLYYLSTCYKKVLINCLFSGKTLKFLKFSCFFIFRGKQIFFGRNLQFTILENVNVT